MPERNFIRQVAGPDAIEAALDRGDPVRLVLYLRDSSSARIDALVERARSLGVRVRPTSDSVLWRLSQVRPPEDALALVGDRPEASLDGLFKAGGAVWLLVGVTYPGNAGFAIRTAEVSGADGIVLSADFDHEAKRQAIRAAMRADWYMPVLWTDWKTTIDEARAHGFSIIGIEDVGRSAPWEIELTGPVLLVVGAEEHGIPEDLLEQCDQTVRIPMQGFIRSYNLQVAVAVVSVERLRQLDR